MTRIAVTGDGLVSALGRSVPVNMKHLYAGVIQPIGPSPLETTLREAPALFTVSAAPSEHGDECTDEHAAADYSRTSRLALTAAREALETAGLLGDGALPSPPRIGVCMGTTVGGTFNDEGFYRAFRRGEHPPLEGIKRYLANDLAAVLAASVGARGPVLTVVNACASGTDAIGVAARWLQAGDCDLVLAGGADELARFSLLGFSNMNASRERCRPFDLNRQGLNLGEGSGVLVLEREADARARRARVLGWVAGYGAAADAYHSTAPHPEGRGLRRALAQALARAGLTARDIGFINTHGTGTIENDRIEGKVLFDLFPEGLPVFSTKGYTGHTTGAAGAIEAILTMRNLLDGRVPASGGLETPDPACCIVPTREVTKVKAQAALSDSLAFGGANAVLVLQKGDEP